MKQNYNITRLFITHILFVSLCLQSCSYFNNYSVSEQEESIKTHDKLTIQAILDKQLMSQAGHIVTFSEEAGKLKARVQVNPLDEVDKVYNEIPVVIEKGTELASLSQLPKKIQQRRIQVKFDENGKPIRIAVHQPWLMGGGDNDGEQQKKDDIRRGKQKAKEGEEEMTDEEEEDYKPVHKKNKVDIEGEKKEDLPTLPVEVLVHILSYIKYPDILSFREYSPLFNELITGYRTPNVFGVQNKPQNCIHTYFWLIGHEIDFLFSKLKDYRPDNIPSFPFYRLMGEIRNLDPAFWPHLQGTNVQVINLSANAIEDTKVTNFSQSLRGTRVKEVELMANIIEGIQAINLQGTRVHTVGLSYNQITAAGGTREFAQNLRGTEVKTINLTGNKIGDAGVIELAQNLQGTEVRRIFLADTNISDHGAVELSRNLRGTKVKEVDLSGNQIGDAKLIEFAQNLQGTEVKTINLSGNQIGDVGVIEFAQNLQETNVEEVILWSNNITQEVMELLLSQYPNIVWFG